MSIIIQLCTNCDSLHSCPAKLFSLLVSMRHNFIRQVGIVADNLIFLTGCPVDKRYNFLFHILLPVYLVLYLASFLFHIGDNVLSIATHLLTSDAMEKGWQDKSSGKVVFFDLLGFCMVSISSTMAIYSTWTFTVASFGMVVFRRSEGKESKCQKGGHGMCNYRENMPLMIGVACATWCHSGICQSGERRMSGHLCTVGTFEVFIGALTYAIDCSRHCHFCTKAGLGRLGVTVIWVASFCKTGLQNPWDHMRAASKKKSRTPEKRIEE